MPKTADNIKVITDRSLCTVKNVPEDIASICKMVDLFLKADIDIEIIAQNPGTDGYKDISFTFPQSYTTKLGKTAEELRTLIYIDEIIIHENSCQILIEDSSLESVNSIIQELSRHDIQIEMIAYINSNCAIIIAHQYQDRLKKFFSCS